MSQSAPAPTVVNNETTRSSFDSAYLTSPPALLKYSIIVVNIVNCCISLYMFLYVLAHICLWFSIFSLWCQLRFAVDNNRNCTWTLYEMALCAAFSFLFMIAATIVAVYKMAASAVFAYLAMALYATEAYFKLRDLRGGESLLPRCPRSPRTEDRPYQEYEQYQP